jgi:hypothetical protein
MPIFKAPTVAAQPPADARHPIEAGMALCDAPAATTKRAALSVRRIPVRGFVIPPLLPN